MNRKRKVSNLHNDCKMACTPDFSNSEISETEINFEKANRLIDENEKIGFSLAELFEFNLIYCDGMVERVMKEIEKL